MLCTCRGGSGVRRCAIPCAMEAQPAGSNARGGAGRRLRAVRATAALAGAVCLTSVSLGGAIPPAPMFGLNAANTNVSLYAGVESGPYVRWQVLHDHGLTDSPALILDGRGVLYASHLTPRLASTGQPAGINIPSEFDSTPAIGASGNIYQWEHGRMHAYAPNGTPLWQGATTNFSDGNGVKIGPDGTIYAGGGNGNLYAFSPQGDLRWTALGYSSSMPPPAIDADGNLYMEGTPPAGRVVRSYDKNGNVRWSAPWNQPGGTPIALGPDGNLYIPEDYGTRMVVRDAATGALIRTQTNLYGGVQAIGAGGVLYSCSYQSVTATDLLGNLIWHASVPPGVFLQDLVVDAVGRVYCTTESDLLYAFSPTGDQLWSLHIPGATYVSLPPIIGQDGTLYVQNAGTLTAIGGVVPEPGAGIAFSLAGLAAMSRRRRTRRRRGNAA